MIATFWFTSTAWRPAGSLDRLLDRRNARTPQPQLLDLGTLDWTRSPSSGSTRSAMNSKPCSMCLIGFELAAAPGRPRDRELYRRYAIQDEAMLLEGAAKLDAWSEAPAAQSHEKRGEVREFPKARNG
jgi:hypothetical protein